MRPLVDALARELHAKCKEKGIAFVDAPVSGGIAGARAGTLSIMAGGEAGVQRMVDIFSSDIQRALQLLGVNSIAELSQDVNPGLVVLRP